MHGYTARKVARSPAENPGRGMGRCSCRAAPRPRTFEAYIRVDDLPQVQRDYAMVAGGAVIVRLHVVSDPVGRQLLECGHVLLAAVAADLSEYDDDRSVRAAGQLVERGIRQ